MTNVILNLVATGVFQELSAIEGFPQRAKSVSIQARQDQVPVQYHYGQQVNFWTIKAGTVRTILFGDLWPGELFVMAAADTVIEIEVSTQLTV